MHPTIFEIGSFKIASYGLMVAIGMLVAVWIAAVRAKKAGQDPVVILDLAIWVVIAGIIGARFMYVFLEGWQGIISQPIGKSLLYFLKIRSGGLSFLGGLMFAVPVGIIYLRWKKLDLWNIADICAPSIAIGIAIARIGCFLNSCCFGKLCDPHAFYAVEFPVGSLPYYHYSGMVTVFPTQLLNSLSCLLIFLILSFFFQYRTFKGQVFWLFAMLYSVGRFSTDFLRGDSDETFFGGLLFGKLTLAQTSCIAGMILSIVMLVLLRRNKSGRIERSDQ